MLYGVPQSAHFYDREDELLELERAWHADSAQLITMWGRRRVGKSTLLALFAGGRRGVYLYGTRTSERELLAELVELAAEALGIHFLHDVEFKGWEPVLDMLAAHAQNERLLLVLDEFGYLCEVSPGLDTVVQRWWDRVSDRTRLMVIIASSGFSFMSQLTGASGPLHGRRTGQVEVYPFDYLDAAGFYGGLTPEDRVRAYAAFGGMPAYLDHWDGRQSLQVNVERTMLTPGHSLFREAEELLRTEFHQEALYFAILRAVANGDRKASDIARSAGRAAVNEIADHLRRLSELRLLHRELPVTEMGRPRTQRTLYRLADPYLRFWFRYIAPNQSFIQLGRGADVWNEQIQPTLDEFVGSTTWEEVCAQYLRRKLRNRELKVRFSELGRWWDGKDEIDLVGLWQGEATLVGECKWSSQRVTEKTFRELQHKAEKLQLAERPLWVLGSRSGFDEILEDRAKFGDLLLIRPADLYPSTLQVREEGPRFYY